MTDRPKLAIIVAKAANGVIGAKNDIPWYLPADLKRFKALTMGCAIIMGRKTWDSLPRKPLPGRPHFVVSRTPQSQPVQDVYWYTAPQTAFAAALAWAKAQGQQTAFVIGGGALYETALEYADVLHITQLRADFEGDVVFPNIDPDDWVQTHVEQVLQGQDPKAPCDYAFCEYARATQNPAKPLLIGL